MQRLLSLVRRCADDYAMLPPGAKIAVGLSGGKDSLLLSLALNELARFHPSRFGVVAITVDLGFPGTDFAPLAAFLGARGIEYRRVPTEIADVVFTARNEKNPCSLCAKMRRGALNGEAKAAGCTHVALGHHLDDAVETFFMSLIFESRINCFKPVTYLSRQDITVIRPMLYVEEADIRHYAHAFELPVVPSACPTDGASKRQEIKELVASLSARYPDIRERVFGALRRSPIDGWRIPE